MFGGKTSRWLVNKTNPEYVDYLSRVSSVSAPFAQILINRGIKTPDDLASFLSPDINKLTDPFDLPGLTTAVARLRSARSRGERVLVHGDYDADGVTATAIMVEGLNAFGVDVHYFIPNRIRNGYGFGTAGVERAKEIGAHLVITVDCGITSFDAVSAAKAQGLDVIVTDHHEPLRSSEGGYSVPEALSVIDPKLTGDARLTLLSGAGVAFKVIQGLFENKIGDVHHLLDLAALGTAADVVPVVGDNRVMLREGIALMRSGQRTGIKALKDVAGIKPDAFRASLLYYVLIPRLNAAGRIADARDVVRLLTTTSEAEAEILAQWLQGLNGMRQEIEESVHREALQMVDALDTVDGPIVIASEKWHPGVIGIVASKIAEAFYRPTFVFSIENGIARGSARSIPPFDIYDGLTRCQGILRRFGGHRQAAGLSLRAEDIGRFRAAISGVILEGLTPDDLVPVLHLDAAVQISDVTLGLIEEISRLEPFGSGNEEPLLGAKGLRVMQPRVVGNNHLKMNLKQKGCSVNGIGFDLGSLLPSLDTAPLIDAAFLPILNEWDGGRYLQLNVKAIRPAVTE